MSEPTEPAISFRHRIEHLGLATLVWLVGRAPYRWLRPIANFTGAAVFLGDIRGRSVALANLDTAFGDSLSPTRKKQIARASYQNFGRTVLELFWAPNLTSEFAHRVTRFEGLEYPCHGDKNQAVIYASLHYSNFEWQSLFSAYVIANGPVIFQAFENPLIQALFKRLRSSTGHAALTQERAMIRMLKHLKSGGKFALLCDLNLDPNESSVIIDTFGGLKVCVTQTHAALALRTNAKIVPVECRPLPDGTYRMIYHKPLEYGPDATAAQIAQMCWDVLEPSIWEQPECWLWSYKHWRFRPANDQTGRYPFYSNVAKRFDRMLKEHGK
ncbi:lysophospholipid acyltransferase family protein [soil metagenome]